MRHKEKLGRVFSLAAKDKCDHAVSVKHAECPEQVKLWLEDALDDVFWSSSVLAYVQQEMKAAWGSASLAARQEQVGWTGA